MKIGVCVNDTSKWKVAGESGYDYIEAQLLQIANASDEEYLEMLKNARECRVPIETTNCFFSKDFQLYSFDPVTGDAVDNSDIEKKVAEYVKKGLGRASEIGIKTVVLGSSFNRRVPEGMKREAAAAQFAEILRICGDEAQKHGIKIAIEPLSDCNLIVTLADAVRSAEAAAHPAIGVLNDFYHSAVNGEDIKTSLKEAGKLLYHMHIACPEGRRIPTIADRDVITELCEELKRIGYCDRISIEGRTALSFEEMLATSYEVMKLVR